MTLATRQVLAMVISGVSMVISISSLFIVWNTNKQYQAQMEYETSLSPDEQEQARASLKLIPIASVKDLAHDCDDLHGIVGYTYGPCPLIYGELKNRQK